MRRLRTALAAGLTTLALAAPLRAEPRIAIDAGVCEDAMTRVERHLAGLDPNASSSLDAAVTFESVEAGIRVTVATRENGVERGESVLLVANCDEAVDATVVVLSLAFSAPSSAEVTNAEAAPSERAPDASERDDNATPVRFVAPSPRVDEPPAGRDTDRASHVTRVSLAGGVDRGTLPATAAFVSGGVTLLGPWLDVRGWLRYGLPTADERVETDLRESVRRDFGALGLGICRGAGVTLRLTLCAGGELGLVRTSRSVALQGASVDEDEHSARLSGVLAALFSLRQGPLRPELEVSGAALALGGSERASRLAFRAAAGAAVDF